MASISSDPPDDGDEVLYATSRRRKLLVADIKAGKHIGMQPKELWLSRHEYQQDKLTLFRSRFYSLRSTIEAATERKERDEKAFVEDTKLGIGTKFLPYPKFKGSDAEAILKNDLDQGLHESMQPTHHGLWKFSATIFIKSYEIGSNVHIGLASAKRKKTRRSKRQKQRRKRNKLLQRPYR
jgi:hypothetical protein